MGERADMSSGRYECRNCHVVVSVGDLFAAAVDGRVSAGRYHAFTDNPSLPCGPVACDMCGEVCFEPWAEDARFPQCMGCAHVCSHTEKNQAHT